MVNWITAFLIFVPLLAPAQEADKIKHEIEKIITYDTETDALNIPHLLVGITMNGKEYYFDFGYQAKSEPVDSSTLFEIGDITKIFTSLLALTLEEQEKIVLDSSWNYFLPAEYHKPQFQFLTLKDLLLHQSGLSKLPAGIGAKESEDYGLFANYNGTDVYDYIASNEGIKSNHFLYSNTGYALAELFITDEVNADFQTLLLDQVSGPYALQQMHTFLSDGTRMDLLQGYDMNRQVIANPTYNTFYGSLGLRASANDLLQFAKQSFETPTAAYQRSLNEFIPIGKKSDLAIGYGWHRLTGKKQPPIFLHTGKSAGFRSYLAMVPSTKTAVVVLSNSKLPQNGLGYYVLKMINFGWKKPKRKKK